MDTKRNLLLLLTVCFLITKGYSQTYIQNVTIVDVINQKLIPQQTVVIDKGVISDIQSSKRLKIPSNANLINAEGKFLMPGMTDAHVHFFQSGGLYTRPDAIDLRNYVPYEKEVSRVHNNMEDFLHRYIQNGITSVIDVGATYNFLQQRDTFLHKPNVPSIYMAGPLLTTYEPDEFRNLKNDSPFKLVSSVEDAKKLVEEQLPYRPDFIKLWYVVMPDSTGLEASAKKYEPIVKTIIEESHKHNLKVAVHATERITAQIAVQNGCDYLVHSVEDEIVPDDFVHLLKSKQIVLCPTLKVSDNYAHTFAQKLNYTTYDLENSNPETIGSIYDLKHLRYTFNDSTKSDTVLVEDIKRRFATERMTSYILQTDSIRNVNLKKLADAGVTIAAGTDAGNIGTQHATSYITELKAMKKSGLSNWQIIQSATINPTKILDKEKTYGSISKGKTADLILLAANPIESLDNLTQINLIFKSGQSIKPNTLLDLTPETLVQQQLNAYNARNIDAFLEPYADSIEIYNFPDQLLGKGKEAMREQYVQIFEQFPNLHCEIKGRIINGNTVIDHESVSGLGQPENMEAIAIYEIKDGKIVKVYFK